MFNSNKDVYDFVGKIIQLLDVNKYFDWSNKFRSALSISFMPGEVFSAIRQCFIEIQATDVPQKIGMVNEINTVIDVLNNALKIE